MQLAQPGPRGASGLSELLFTRWQISLRDFALLDGRERSWFQEPTLHPIACGE